MLANKIVLGILALTATNAMAGGRLGTTLGQRLGDVLGLTLGTSLPLVGGGLLAVAAASLVIGIRIAKRKKNP